MFSPWEVKMQLSLITQREMGITTWGSRGFQGGLILHLHHFDTTVRPLTPGSIIMIYAESA